MPYELLRQSDSKPRLLAEILVFVFVIALIGLNIGLLGFFSGPPVNSTYANKWVHEPAPAWPANGRDSADGHVRDGRACCQMIP